MTLKAAWITPNPECSLCTLTLESSGVSAVERLNVLEHVFPFPVDAPQRHTVQLGLLSVEDIDMLQQLLTEARELMGYRQHKVSKGQEQPEAEFRRLVSYRKQLRAAQQSTAARHMQLKEPVDPAAVNPDSVDVLVFPNPPAFDSQIVEHIYSVGHELPVATLHGQPGAMKLTEHVRPQSTDLSKLLED